VPQPLWKELFSIVFPQFAKNGSFQPANFASLPTPQAPDLDLQRKLDYAIDRHRCRHSKPLAFAGRPALTCGYNKT
jgi:hypothetical protein